MRLYPHLEAAKVDVAQRCAVAVLLLLEMVLVAVETSLVGPSAVRVLYRLLTDYAVPLRKRLVLLTDLGTELYKTPLLRVCISIL